MEAPAVQMQPCSIELDEHLEQTMELEMACVSANHLLILVALGFLTPFLFNEVKPMDYFWH